MYLKLSDNTFIPKYPCGTWKFDDKAEKFVFTPKEADLDNQYAAPYTEFSIKFKDTMNQVEELIFRKKFARPDYSNDSDVIVIQDIKDLVFFLAPSSALTKSFVDFFHQQTIDQFLNALIIYFEYFLKIVEYMLIQRDEAKGSQGKIKNEETIRVQKMLSEYLTQHRLILAKEYSKIILGTGDMQKYHHLANKIKTSKTIHDKALHQTFLSFCTQIVWIAVHRKAYSVIDCEINRLLCSGHFNAAEKQSKDLLKYTPFEQQVLFGKNDKRTNYRTQKSPLIEELLNVSKENSDILRIGEHKYRGTNPRIYQLEMEYIVPDSQLSFIDVTHGILGHPKKLYNTMLALNWHAVRKSEFSDNYDPYRIIRQPYLEIPKWEEFIKKHHHVEPKFKCVNLKYSDNILLKQKRVWKNRDKIINSMSHVKLEDFNVTKKAERILAKTADGIQINRTKIVNNFLMERKKLKIYKEGQKRLCRDEDLNKILYDN